MSKQRQPIPDSSPVVFILTSRPFHPTVQALVAAGGEFGVTMRCGPSIDRRSSIIFQWSFARRSGLRAVQDFCDYQGIEFVNGTLLGKWDQLVRLSEHDLPFPDSRRASSLTEARHAAELLQYPVVIKPNWGFRSDGVELVRNDVDLLSKWSARHRVVQTYLPEGARCTRVLVVDGRATHAVTRVAKDGFHATYDHGRRGTLQPYVLDAAHADIAVAAARAVGAKVAGVDLVATVDGPVILEVNHGHVEFADHDLHGATAVTEVAKWLAERALRRGWKIDLGIPMLQIVTSRPHHPSVALLREATQQRGFRVDVGREATPAATATWFWGVQPAQHRRAARQVRTLSIHAVNGNAQTLWRQRALLFRAGLAIPRSRFANTLAVAQGAADELGFPVVIRRDVIPGNNRPICAQDDKALTAAWGDQRAARRIIEPAKYAFAPRIRVWVAAERAFRAAQRRHGGSWKDLPLEHAPYELAVAACHVLGTDLGIVELAIVDDKPSVLWVRHRERWNRGLDPATSRAALRVVSQQLRARLGGKADLAPTRSRPKLNVLIARPLPSHGMHTPNIHALRNELLRRGHTFTHLDGRLDTQLVAKADVVLQDPLAPFGTCQRN